MDIKANLLKQFVPLAVLEALTPEARAAVPPNQCTGQFIPIKKFPFRIGRESRVRIVNGKAERLERPKLSNRETTNDLYLVDQGDFLNISREHLHIDQKGSGYILVDRGSACGTRVENVTVGGDDAGGVSPLDDGDVIALGVKGTPYIYRFISFDDYCLTKKESVNGKKLHDF